MIYGKINCAIESEFGQIFVTVAHPGAIIKQNSDLIRLTMNDAHALAYDLISALVEIGWIAASNKPA